MPISSPIFPESGIAAGREPKSNRGWIELIPKRFDTHAEGFPLPEPSARQVVAGPFAAYGGYTGGTCMAPRESAAQSMDATRLAPSCWTGDARQVGIAARRSCALPRGAPSKRSRLLSPAGRWRRSVSATGPHGAGRPGNVAQRASCKLRCSGGNGALVRAGCNRRCGRRARISGRTDRASRRL